MGRRKVERNIVFGLEVICCVFGNKTFFFPSMAWFLAGTTDLGAETTLTL